EGDWAGLYVRKDRCRGGGALYARALGALERGGAEETLRAVGVMSLASLYASQARYREAEPFYLRLVALHTLGPQHPDLAMYLNNLGEIYRLQGKGLEAERQYWHAIAIREGMARPDKDLQLAIIVRDLRGVYVAGRRYSGAEPRDAEAEPLYERVVAIREAALGARHRDVAASVVELAGVYLAQAKLDQAEAFYVRGLEIREQVLEREHPLIASTLHALARLYADEARYAEAEPLYVRALQIREHVLGPDHPWLAPTLQ